MRFLLATVLVLHGTIHLLGFLKGFGLADAPQLSQPISRPTALLWLAATVLSLASASVLFSWPRSWWLTCAAVVVVSQLAILTSWSDAKFGTLVNCMLLVAVIQGFFSHGPRSFEAEFRRDVEPRLARETDAPPITNRDLATLPELIRRYLQKTGALGAPRVHNYQLRFRGRIRSDRASAWMPFEAVQQSFVEAPTRLFLMSATMKGLPVQAFHRLVDGSATMRVRVAGVLPLVDASGPVMDRSETVTMFNDMCLLAPGSLLHPSITWEAIDARSVRARFTSRGNTITATLVFDDEGLLRNFHSDDRSRSIGNGSAFVPQGFSTPVSEYRDYGRFRLPARAEARWHPPEGEFAYGEFELLEVTYNAKQFL